VWHANTGVDGVLVKRDLLTYVYSNLHDSLLTHRSRTEISFLMAKLTLRSIQANSELLVLLIVSSWAAPMPLGDQTR